MEKRAAVVVSIQGGRRGRKGINVDTVAQTGNALALSNLSLKFLGPLRICLYIFLIIILKSQLALIIGDRLTVRVSVSNSSDTRIYFEDIIVKIPNQEPILEAQATLLWLNKNYRPTRIPPEVRSKLV
uniref:Uncharacterized protein n=1 Tax=Lactuca sativa TaxID=4236 RepID=A0A9R1VB69_LACSA|nr:hypothetical protein LSAT_V11C600325260 [Lactuca sativa]